jgi:hypothetical protein
MIPNLFSKIPIPKNIPKELERKIREFSRGRSKEEFLKRSFFYLASRYPGSRVNFVLKFGRLFEKDIFVIWNYRDYVHCTTMNYLFRIMLVKSGLFKDDDIQFKLTNSWYIMIHQYLDIRLPGNKHVTLDPWNYPFGIDYGKYGHGFSSIHMNPIR